MAWCDVACPPHGRAPGRGSHRPLVVSDLRRARQTAQALASHHGLALRVEPLWREQSFGVLEGGGGGGGFAAGGGHAVSRSAGGLGLAQAPTGFRQQAPKQPVAKIATGPKPTHAAA